MNQNKSMLEDILLTAVQLENMLVNYQIESGDVFSFPNTFYPINLIKSECTEKLAAAELEGVAV